MSTYTWGPQAWVSADIRTQWWPSPLRSVDRGRNSFWVVLASGVIAGFVVAFAALLAIEAAPAAEPCLTPECHQYPPSGPSQYELNQRAAQQVEKRLILDYVEHTLPALATLHLWPLLASARVRRHPPKHGMEASTMVVVAVLFPTFALAYGIGALLGGPRLRPLPELAPAPPYQSTERMILTARDPYAAAHHFASSAYGYPGGHIGWTENGNYIGARPRGGMLVIGPPGSGKTSAIIVPSVIIAPAACVASSIKGDVMAATAHLRTRGGRCWHFDPGGDEPTLPSVLQCRWSPLMSIRTWDDARRIASRMALPAREAASNGASAGAGDAHFLDRARDWLEVLLFTAKLDHRPIGDVADWAATATANDTNETVLAILLVAADRGDQGAQIAARQLEGLLAIPDRERGSIVSTLSRLLRVYGSITARDLGKHPNFDPAAFVRGCDTLYITASPERQHEYAPLIAGLLEEIRYAVYARHRAEEAGREPSRPHVTFVLDEANNTAPVPLPAIISEAGGQSLHVIVGIQDLSRARGRWGREAEGFLTLFPTKVVLAGIVEPYTLDALSNAAGEYDRIVHSYSENTSFIGPYSRRVQHISPSYSVHRLKVLHQGQIANLPHGCALHYEGASWKLARIGMHWEHPVWGHISAVEHATRR